MTVTVRLSRLDELAILQDIERRAGEAFRAIGMPEIADDEPASIAELAEYAVDEQSWVAVDATDSPIGYVLVDVVDGCAHIEQLSVMPDHQGAGVGRALVARVGRWATERNLAAITLTSFRDVPWNAPLYRHLGFHDLADADIGPELAARRAEEAVHGLDPAHRVCLRFDLRSSLL